MDDAIPVEATPVRPNKVRLIPPEGIGRGRSVLLCEAATGRVGRVRYAPGRGAGNK